ncbi:hypothetical protein MRX96_042018 [Rhipicephalus microplus]
MTTLKGEIPEFVPETDWSSWVECLELYYEANDIVELAKKNTIQLMAQETIVKNATVRPKMRLQWLVPLLVRPRIRAVKQERQKKRSQLNVWKPFLTAYHAAAMVVF